MNTGTICLSLMLASCVLAADQDATERWKESMKRVDSLRSQHKYAEAVEEGKRGVTLAESFGSADARLATSHYLLGATYRDWWHCPEARAQYARAVAIFEAKPRSKPTFVFKSLISLISEACECDDTAAAASLMKEHRAALQRYSSGPLDDAKILGLEAGIARGQGHQARAEERLRKALHILDNTPGADVTDLGEITNALGVVLNQEHHYKESLIYAERAIGLFESVDPRSPSLIAALNNAACVRYAVGQKQEAERDAHRAVKLALEVFGEDSRLTARVMLNYAALIRAIGPSEEAAAIQEKAASALRRSLVRENSIVDVQSLRLKP